MRCRVFLASAFSLAVLVTPIRAAGAANLILNTQDFPPFSYLADGVVAGPAADVIRRVCGDMKIECSLQLLPWRRAQQEVEEGKAHGMFLIGWNAERAKWLYFSPALLTTEYGFFVRNDSPLTFRQDADVKGYTVGVYGPSNTATALEQIRAQIKDLAIDMTPDERAAFKKLSLGRVDAVFSNKDVGNDLIRKLDITNVRYAGREQNLKYYIGFSQKFADGKLVEQFNATLRALQRTGTIQEILSRYGMNAAPAE